MLYHLLAPLGKDVLIFNLFTYISFRAAAAMLTALLLAFLAGRIAAIPLASARELSAWLRRTARSIALLLAAVAALAILGANLWIAAEGQDVWDRTQELLRSISVEAWMALGLALAKLAGLAVAVLVGRRLLRRLLARIETAINGWERLADNDRFEATVPPAAAERFLVAALLHDLGHWPFCHPIEDISLRQVPSHELFANSFLLEGELADVLRHEWNIQPRDVIEMLSHKPADRCGRLLRSMLSGPIDVAPGLYDGRNVSGCSGGTPGIRIQYVGLQYYRGGINHNSFYTHTLPINWNRKTSDPAAQKYTAADGRIRVSLAKQPSSPTGISKGPATLAEGGIQRILADLGAVIDDEEGRVVADDDGRTEVPGLFVAGDILNKAQQIVTAMAGGLRAAVAVNHDLLAGPPSD